MTHTPSGTDALSAEEILEYLFANNTAGFFLNSQEECLEVIKQRDQAREAKLVDALGFYAGNEHESPSKSWIGYDHGRKARQTLTELGYSDAT